MENYHTATQEDYDALMIELEGKGCKWLFGSNPTDDSSKDRWNKFGKDTYVRVENGKVTFGSVLGSYQELYSDYPLIEYKAKGDSMTQEEFEQQSHDLVVNIASTIGTFEANLELTDEDLDKTQKLVKKFDETLTEFIDSRKHKFDIGNYVTDDLENDPFVCKVEKIEDGDVNGNWYSINKKYFDDRFSSLVKICRLATQEEIAEYKAALNFYKHGRNPFEIKDGDLIANGDGISHIVENAHSNKELFLLNNLKLLATAEELDKWLGADDE